jgi:hypothetical protein
VSWQTLVGVIAVLVSAALVGLALGLHNPLFVVVEVIAIGLFAVVHRWVLPYIDRFDRGARQRRMSERSSMISLNVAGYQSTTCSRAEATSITSRLAQAASSQSRRRATAAEYASTRLILGISNRRMPKPS